MNFEQLTMRVTRAVVHGRVKTVRTEYSEDELPLRPGLRDAPPGAEATPASRSAGGHFNPRYTGLNLVFPSPLTARHYHAVGELDTCGTEVIDAYAELANPTERRIFPA